MNFDFNKLLKQAQKMQEKMGDIQSELESVEITGRAGGVTIVSNAKYEFKSVTIDPQVLKDAGDDPEMLADLILAALKDLGAQANKVAEDKMMSLTAGMNIPGLKLPGF